ncbi:hypothetical protein FIV02_14280 [Pseudomonas sp. THAF187a]|uniref:hypothetical protein n=1 Tax=unclassified Pseudomonas TaxID=196821 RepID=UPI0012678EFB|nr:MULTISPECIES: hypothetical protein [unclassified Pseudomonas]QFT22738.1 hypothetical protein FIV02_14280 [Pseudomonas sp. THAF187a]QFT42925.1 hypothetical protein FIU98_14260 [Pseudomonas sp. THAF42]
MTSKKVPPPSIEVKTNYVHKGIVEDMLRKREAAGVEPIAILTTASFSSPAIKLLDSKNIAWAVIPESEIKGTEGKEQEKK